MGARVVERTRRRDPLAQRLGLRGVRDAAQVDGGELRIALAGGDQRERHGPVEQVGAAVLPGALGRAGDVEDVVEDLEAQADAPPERAEVEPGLPGRERAEPARGFEQPGGLELAAQQVAIEVDGGVPGVGALQQLAAGEGGAGVAEDADRFGLAALRQRRERAREERVAGGDGQVAAPAARRRWGARAAGPPGRARRRGRASRCGRARRRRPSGSARPPARGRAGGPPASSTSSGRRRLPPAATVALPSASSGAPCATASARSRASTARSSTGT